jgi:uncharacterized Zn-finger protein
MSYPKKSLIEKPIFIKESQLPFSCPPVGEDVEFQHPRVFLYFENKKAVCPFCGSDYRIEDDLAQ